ncbi:MAG: energy transducer TonB [Burkholderiaceae bacterium]|nr:energy transducer TonB [Burkholderiaceae bacterium]
MHSIGEASAAGDGGRRVVGIGTTLLLHATLGWAAWSGLDAPTPTVPVPLEVRFIEAVQPAEQAIAAATPAAPPAPAQQVRAEPPSEPVVEPPPAPLAEAPSAVVEAPPQVVAEAHAQPVVRKPHRKPVRKVEKPRPAAKAPRIVEPPPRIVEPPPVKIASPEPPPQPPPIAAAQADAVPSRPVSPATRAAASPSAVFAAPPPLPVPALAAAAPAVPTQAPRFDAAYLRNPPPAYPRAARRLGEEGRVVLRVRVERDGSPSKLEVQASSGSTRLDEAAFDAVRHWRFVAARRGEDKIAAWVLVPIEFRLDNG